MTLNRALMIVDVQPTFCEGGELPVSGGHAIAAAIADFVARRRTQYSAIITSQDWHIDPLGHFATKPDFVDTWPPHGLAGTDSALLHPALLASLGEEGADLTIHKGQYAAAYSAFDGTDTDGRTLASLLTAANISALDVCGIAESHCVRATALDAVAAGLAVTVLADLTVPVTAVGGAQARAAIRAAGGLVEPSSSPGWR